METLLLSLSDVNEILSMKDVIEAVEEGYLAFQKGCVEQPDIVSMEMPEFNGETDIKSCYNGGNQIISVKVTSLFSDNGKKNDLPAMVGSIILFDGTTGAPLCVMDGSLITGIRTGAAGAISSKLLARKDSKTVAVFGGGGQARMQIYGLCQVMDTIETVRVFSPYPAELPAYKKEVEAKTGKKVIICETAAEAMEGADIAISTTPSKQYLVDADLVKPGMHIVAVGADMEGKNEWDPRVFKGAKVVNDNIAQCLTRGETRNAVVQNIIAPSDIYGEIGEILSGAKPGRTSDTEITIFDTTGMAIQDNVTAMRVYEAAKEKNMGKWFSFL